MVKQVGNITIIDNIPPEREHDPHLFPDDALDSIARYVFVAAKKFYANIENEIGFLEDYKKRHGEYPPEDEIWSDHLDELKRRGYVFPKAGCV